MKNDEAHLRLTIDVHYELGRTDIRDLERVLVGSADHLAGEGLLSGDTEASVLTWSSAVSTPNVKLSGGEAVRSDDLLDLLSRAADVISDMRGDDDPRTPIESDIAQVLAKANRS
jgi:hypothetical protein